jgi:hypothetical protein
MNDKELLAELRPKTKYCPACDAEKPIGEFWRLRRNKTDGRQPFCKECQSRMYAAWCAKHPGHKTEQRKRRRATHPPPPLNLYQLDEALRDPKLRQIIERRLEDLKDGSQTNARR